jgi:hypothetical protein
MSVRLSFRIQKSDSHRTNFREISYWEVLPKYVETSRFLFQSDKNIRDFTSRPPYIYGLPPWMTAIFLQFSLWVTQWSRKNYFCNWDGLCSLLSYSWGWRNSWAWSMIDCKVPSIGVWGISIENLPNCYISMTMRWKRCCHDTGNSYIMCLNTEWLFLDGT